MTKARKPSLGPRYRKIFTASVISNLGDGVSLIGYPWLASAVTRNAFLIALVGVAQRLPWLAFTLPAGVITDRVDRRKAMVVMDVMRGTITAFVAVAVLGLGGHLPSPSHVTSSHVSHMGLYLILLFASMLLGMGEVLRDNAAQTIIPSIVEPANLERANGRMWSAQEVATTFVGPPLGSLLIAVAFFLPFVVDATSFFVAAGLVFLVAGQFRSRPADVPPAPRGAWKAELKEGVSWLWGHSLLRPMAIVLGCLNAIGMLQFSTLVLYAQEILHTGPVTYALMGMGAAVGGVIGGYTAPAIRERLGSGPSLWLTLFATALTPIPIAFFSWWPVVFLMMGIGTLVGTVWNVITVSLRQTIIPDHLLGRVNSVYRFFAWGMMPIGTAIGGLVVVLAKPLWGREWALRAPFLAASVLGALLLLYALPRLTTERMDAARAEGLAAKERPAADADVPATVD